MWKRSRIPVFVKFFPSSVRTRFTQPIRLGRLWRCQYCIRKQISVLSCNIAMYLLHSGCSVNVEHWATRGQSHLNKQQMQHNHTLNRDQLNGLWLKGWKQNWCVTLELWNWVCILLFDLVLYISHERSSTMCGCGHIKSCQRHRVDNMCHPPNNFWEESHELSVWNILICVLHIHRH